MNNASTAPIAMSSQRDTGYLFDGPTARVRLSTCLRDALWITFIAVASYAASPLKDYNVERVAWLAADVLAVALFVARPAQVLTLARRHMAIMSWPLLACVSALWSLTPVISLYHGIQLLMTILVGFSLCLTHSLEQILKLLFTALLGSAMLSLLFILVDPAGAIASGGEWLGVFPHKNVLGHMMVLLAFTGICLFLQGWRPVVTAAGILFAMFLMLMSKSGVAAVALAVVLGPMLLALLYQRGPMALTMGGSLLLIAFSAAILTVELNDIDMDAVLLGLLGKDATLTGRTLLWDFGIEAYMSRPWLGFGYKAWWESGETAAPVLRFVIGQDLWFFHNNYIDVAVAFGAMGPVLFVLGLGAGVLSTLRAFLKDPKSGHLWRVLFIIFVTVLTFVENPLFQNHSIHQLLLVVAIAAAARGGWCDVAASTKSRISE